MYFWVNFSLNNRKYNIITFRYVIPQIIKNQSNFGKITQRDSSMKAHNIFAAGWTFRPHTKKKVWKLYQVEEILVEKNQIFEGNGL